MSVAFGLSASGMIALAPLLDDEPPAFDEDEPLCPDGCGIGFISRAISRFTSSTDCNVRINLLNGQYRELKTINT